MQLAESKATHIIDMETMTCKIVPRETGFIVKEFFTRIVQDGDGKPITIVKGEMTADSEQIYHLVSYSVEENKWISKQKITDINLEECIDAEGAAMEDPYAHEVSDEEAAEAEANAAAYTGDLIVF